MDKSVTGINLPSCAQPVPTLPVEQLPPFFRHALFFDESAAAFKLQFFFEVQLRDCSGAARKLDP